MLMLRMTYKCFTLNFIKKLQYKNFISLIFSQEFKNAAAMQLTTSGLFLMLPKYMLFKIKAIILFLKLIVSEVKF